MIMFSPQKVTNAPFPARRTLAPRAKSSHDLTHHVSQRGKICTIAESPVNKGLGVLQMSVAK
jgi:hypothetical protein